MVMSHAKALVNQWFRALLSVALVFTLFISHPLLTFGQQSQKQAPPQSQSQQPKNLWQALVNSLTAPSVKVGLPAGNPEARGRRGQCPVVALDIGEVSLTALAPRASERRAETQWYPESMQDIVWGRTVAAYPTFWFYLPYHQQDDLKFAKFVLLDENKKVVVGPILLQLPDAAAVAGRPVLAKFTLPKSVQPLAADQTYNWFFSIVCDARKPSKNPSVSGWIERVKPPYPIALYQGLPTANDYLYYAQAGLWYDTVTRIADSRMQSLQPQIKPAAPDIGKTQPAASASLEDDWLGLFQFLFQSPGLSDEQLKKMANQVANAQIVDLVPVAIAQPTGRVAQP